MLYYLVFFILSLCVILDANNVSKSRKVWLYASFVIFFILLSGLRWRTGSDWDAYHFFYTQYDPSILWFNIAMDPGFGKMIHFLRIFSKDFTFYLLFIACITISLKSIFFYKYTDALFLALIIYWSNFLADITPVRQSLAISICFISTTFIINKKPFYFILLVFIAMQMHVSAFIYLLAYPIYYLKWSVRSKIFFLVLSVVLGLAGSATIVLTSFSQFLPSGAGDISLVAAKADHYLRAGSDKTYGNGFNKTQQILAGIVKRGVVIPIFLYFQDKIKFRNNTYNGFLNIFVFGNVIYFIVADFLTIQRMITYFYPFEILLICYVFEFYSNKKVSLSLILSYSLVKLIYYITSASDLLVPYYSIFSNTFYREKF